MMCLQTENKRKIQIYGNVGRLPSVLGVVNLLKSQPSFDLLSVWDSIYYLETLSYWKEMPEPQIPHQ